MKETALIHLGRNWFEMEGNREDVIGLLVDLENHCVAFGWCLDLVDDLGAEVDYFWEED